MMKNNRGFTFIEMLITLSVLSISFLPLMDMFTTSLVQVKMTGELATAKYLAQEEMEKSKNLNFTVEQFRQQGDVWNPPLEEPAIELNGNHFRVLRKIVPESNPLEVHVQVFKEEDMAGEEPKSLVDLVTLFEDFEWDYEE